MIISVKETRVLYFLRNKAHNNLLCLQGAKDKVADYICEELLLPDTA